MVAPGLLRSPPAHGAKRNELYVPAKLVSFAALTFFSNIILLLAHKISIQFEEYYKYYPFFLRNKIVVTPNWVRLVENINFIRIEFKFQRPQQKQN